MFKLCAPRPSQAVYRGVSTLLEREKMLDQFTRRTFWETHLRKSEGYLEGIGTLRGKDPTPPELADLDTIELELKATMVPAFLSIEQKRLENWHADAHILRSLVFSNVIAYSCTKGAGCLEEMWQIYVDVCHQLRCKPALEDTSQGDGEGFRTFESADSGFRVSVPIVWTIPNHAHMMAEQKPLQFFFGPKVRGFRVNLHLDVEPKPAGVENLHDHVAYTWADGIPATLKLTDLGYERLGAYQACVQYAQQTKPRLDYLIALWIDEFSAWQAWLTKPEGGRDDYLPLFKGILRTFRRLQGIYKPTESGLGT